MRLERYATTVSSRRALLSTLVALNPDSYASVEMPAKKTEKKEDGKKKANAVHIRSVSNDGASGSGSASGSESESSSETSTKTQVEVPAKEDEQTLPKSPFPEGAIKFLDPILAPGKSRSAWEQAMYEALKEVMSDFFKYAQFPQGQELLLPAKTKEKLCCVKKHEPPEGSTLLPTLSKEWNAKYKEQYKDQFYWKRFIPEGIYVAAIIREKVGLERSARKVGYGPRADP